MKALSRHSIQLPGSTSARVLLGVGIAHFLFILWLGLTRHWGYLTSANDLGVYDQAIWGILHGAPFLNTATDFAQPISRLAIHFDPILALFAPFYAIYPAAEWLILAQALAISITAWPLYLLGIRVMRSESAALLWALVYLFNPFVISAAAWDFQTVSLAAPLMALAMLAIESRNARLLLASCFMLLMIREHYGIALVGFGVLWWLRQRTLRPALLAAGMGLGGFVLVLGVIMTALSPTGGHVMMSQELGQLSRYGWLGNSLPEVLTTLLLHPVDVMRTVCLEMGGADYLLLLLGPLLFMPLVGVEMLLPALADLAVNLLSHNRMPRSIFAYHSIAIIPLLMAAGMLGAARIARLSRYLSLGIGVLVLGSSLPMTYMALPMALPGAANIWHPLERPLWPDPSLAEIRTLLPPDASVSAQAHVAPHFMHRSSIRAFPHGVGEADCVVLRLASPTSNRGGDPGEIGSLAHHLKMPPSVYLDEVRDLVMSGNYGLKYWNAPWLVLCKGLDLPAEEADMILVRTRMLERTWRPPHADQ
ncbi:MAG: DUF2079 domain-containing protein [Halothiobacillaceae bacterium]|nr:MAG: DUF2079 domain-containing protein [Halothiobacillaceae bacterium]